MHRNAESRAEDWDTLAFQAEKAGEELRRAQIRYIGSGGTGDHRQDDKILQADHFTFSNMKLPPGAIGPEHNHHDAEEVFSSLRVSWRSRFTIFKMGPGRLHVCLGIETWPKFRQACLEA